MAQWGVRPRVVFLGQHEEKKPRLSSRITDEENSTDEVKGTITVKTRPLEFPKIKKKKRLSRNELKQAREALHGEQRKSSSKGRTKKCDNVSERWAVNRYNLAEQSMLDVLKAVDATFENPISRIHLRSLARERIGDTGLLDHLLKQIDGKLAPGGNERFRRWFNPKGVMEYWLESADLANLRKEAGVLDPFWIPPSRLTPGGVPLDNSVSAGELKLLKEEVDKMKSDMQELLLSKKQEKDRDNQDMLKELAKWKTQTEITLKVVLGSWKSMQDKFDELMTWKDKVEQRIEGTMNVSSDMQVPKQCTPTSPEASEQWEDWLENTNLSTYQGNELVPWFGSTNLVNGEEEVMVQDPYSTSTLRSMDVDSSFPNPLCKIKDARAGMERDVHGLVPKKRKEYHQANVTPDPSATGISKSEHDDFLLFQEMFQELVNWKSTTEQRLNEVSNSVSFMKQTSKVLTPPPPQLPEDGNHSMEYHPCFMF